MTFLLYGTCFGGLTIISETEKGIVLDERIMKEKIII
jgi:hypothetical protein